MSAPKQKNINLLVQQGFENSSFGKILSWLLSTGRVIVIITELIVIIAFISRFWLDKTLTDLSEANAGKKTQLEASLPFEKDFKSVQNRISIIKELDTDKENAAELLSRVAQLVPDDVALSLISVSGNKATIGGQSLSEAGIAQLISSLDTSKQFTNTNLSDIALENGARQVVKFKITTEIIKTAAVK